MIKVKGMHQALPAESQQLMEEAFHILSYSDDDEPNFTSSAEAVKRIKTIITSGHEGVNPNLLCDNCGESLLYATVLHYDLDEGHALELVGFLLDNGADPNIANVMDGDKALDWLVWNYQDDIEMTEEQRSIVKALKERGAKLSPKKDDHNGSENGMEHLM